MTWIFDSVINWIEQAGTWLINQLIISLGALVSSIVGLLPNMPSFPSLGLPSSVQTWFDYGAYWFPFGYLLDVIALVITLWLAWMVLVIPLRWAKAVRGNQ